MVRVVFQGSLILMLREMPHYKYLIIGGGMTADAAAQGIREVDASGEIGIIYYRTLADYRRLRALTEKHKRFAVIGNGFIGSEIAAALAMNGKEVVMIFPGGGICHRIFPGELSQFVTNYYREKGVEILAG